MSQTPHSESIGFYTVEQSDTLGWTGGYLILNHVGRPLEFHCTLPVRPTRAHEILYGATLRGHLIGERIGTTLLKQARVRPLIVCGDQPEILRLADHVDTPVVWVRGDAACGADAAEETHVPTITAPHDRYSLRIEARFATRVREALERLADLPDFAEPFARIREAIREAQQGATARAA